MAPPSQRAAWGEFQSPEQAQEARNHSFFRAKMRTSTTADGHVGDVHLDVRDLEFLHQQLPSVPPCEFHNVTTPLATGDLLPHHDEWNTAPFPTTAPLKTEEQETATPPLPSKRSKWTRRLVITKQPSSEFYKDEGGKANALEVEVSLVEFDENGEPARSPDSEFIDIPLRLLLFFEDGKRVDDADQEIFRFVGNEYDSVVIRASTRKASAQFRLEKVSRRKDGKRFRLRIEVDQEQCTANYADLSPIFTNAICVLSKRKHHAQPADNANRVREPPLKLLKRDFTRMEEKMDTQVASLTEEIRRLSRQVHLQSELLSKMFMPMTSHSTTPPLLPPENATMEWFLKSGLLDESPFTRAGQGPTLVHQAPLPYFTVADDSDERDDPYSSPLSSEDSVVDSVSNEASSPLAFAEF